MMASLPVLASPSGSHWHGGGSMLTPALFDPDPWLPKNETLFSSWITQLLPPLQVTGAPPSPAYAAGAAASAGTAASSAIPTVTATRLFIRCLPGFLRC